MPEAVITADPEFADLATEELQQSATDVHIIAELAPGILLTEFAESFWELAESWREAPPIFVRHICPVQVQVPLAAGESDLESLQAAVVDEILMMVEPDWAFSVQSRILTDLPYKPFDINNALATTIRAETDASLDVRHPEQILSVVCAAMSLDEPPQAGLLAFLGLSPTVHNLSDWAGGVRRFARENGQISRAEFKLLEALEVFQIELPANGVALDLGAAPGGWTRVLRQRQQYVTAVDPAALDARLDADRGVRHKRMTAQEYLADDPDQFDLIVNDMRMDARDSARLMVGYAAQLYAHGIALMTFKLPGKGRHQVLDHAFNILEDAYEIAGARQLFHNRSEITVYLRKRG